MNSLKNRQRLLLLCNPDIQCDVWATLRSDATRYELVHELAHMKTWERIGTNEHMRSSISCRYADKLGSSTIRQEKQIVTSRELALQKAVKLFEKTNSGDWKLMTFDFIPETKMPGLSSILAARWVATFNIETRDMNGLECTPDFCMVIVDDATGEASFFDTL